MNTPSHSDSEIDVFQITTKVKKGFERLNTLLFNCIQFFVHQWKIVAALLIIGFGFGLFLDKSNKLYTHEITVIPNFGSVDFLYAKINLLQSKINAGDAAFLQKEVGLIHPEALRKIEIKPIADVYKFIEEKERNFELIKLMAEVGEVKKVLEDNITSKNYTYHNIAVVTVGITNEKELITPLMNYLNQSDYFSAIQEVEVANLKQTIAQNDTIIQQINGILNGFSANVKSSLKNDKLMYYNENTQLNDIIRSKRDVLFEQSKNRLKVINFQKTIKEITFTLNSTTSKVVNGVMKFVLPLFLVLLFVFIRLFIRFYQKQLAKSKTAAS
ncbi:hypothetical protein [Flavobacterium succinicans]|uniref:Chain length determinant protein n=1 Tax=Flavobacterium succinicans TaxID=29536 RepID=A0A199XPU2_9FLAO|nr:hypothetical protein [Flavobacterium succinicans]OAZ03349.1 hypothetical protein FLB_21360 [Flavobacterium succinicans]